MGHSRMARTLLRASASSIAILFLHTAGSLPARAQSVTTLDTTEVTSTKTEEKAIDSLAAVSTVRQDQIDVLQPDRVSDMFYGTPGIWFSQELGTDPAATAINIRGLQDFGRVAVIIDGARQNYQRSGHQANGTFYLDPELLSGADIVRGPVANIYGSGAIGGVASFTTKDVDDVLRPGEKWGVLSHGMIGSNNPQLLGSAFFAARPSENVDVIAGGSFRNRSDYKDAHGDTVANTGSNVGSGLAKITLRPADGHEIKLGATYYHGDYDSGQPNGSGVFDNTAENLNLTAKYHYSRPETPLVDLTASAYYTETKDKQVVKSPYAFDIFTGDPCTTPGVGTCAAFTGAAGEDRAFKIVTKGFDVNNTSRFNTGALRHTVTVGGDYFTDKVTIDGATDPGAALTPGGNRDVGGGFLQWRTDYSTWLQVIGALRYDAYSLKGIDPGTGSNGSRLSPKITVGITPVPGFTPYFTYAEGYRAPAVTETLIDGFHPGNIFLFLPNPDLKPEIGKNLEAGINLKYDSVFSTGDKFRAKFNVFRNNVDDYIDLVTIGYNPFGACNVMSAYFFCEQYQNIDKARLQGVELESNYDAGKWLGGLSYTYIDGRNVDTHERLATVPPNRLAAMYGMRFLDNRVAAIVRWQHLWGLDDNPATGEPTKAYDLVGVTLAYKQNEDTTWSLIVDNLLNKYYVPYLQDLPSPGITVKGSLQIRFGSDSLLAAR